MGDRMEVYASCSFELSTAACCATSCALRALDRRAVGLDGSSDRVGAGARLLGDVLRDDAGLGELRLPLRGERRVFRVRSVAHQLGFGLAEQGLIAQHVGFDLPEQGLERPLVDGEQQLVFLDEIAFVNHRRVDRARDLGPDRNHGVRFDVADGRDVHRHVARGDLGGDDGHGAAFRLHRGPGPGRRRPRRPPSPSRRPQRRGRRD